MSHIPALLKNRPLRIALQIAAVLFGIFLSAFLVFQVLFLYRVLPHGGIW